MNPDPDPVCSQRSDPDPVQIGPDPQHCLEIPKSPPDTVGAADHKTGVGIF